MFKWISLLAIGSTTTFYLSKTNVNNIYDIIFNSNCNTTIMNGLFKSSFSSSLDSDWTFDNTINDDVTVYDGNNTIRNSCPITTPKYTHKIDDLKLYCNDEILTNNNNQFINSNTNRSKLFVSNKNNSLSNVYNLNNYRDKLLHQYSFTNYYPTTEFIMNDTVGRTSSIPSTTFGYNSIQERIEIVKSDLDKLTNKINTKYPPDSDGNNLQHYGLGFGDYIIENDEIILTDIDEHNSEKELDDDKTWRCPSQYNNVSNGDNDIEINVNNDENNINYNPYSELSENTQRILSRLNIKHSDIDENNFDGESFNLDDSELEMDDETLEFTLPMPNQNISMFTSFLSRGSSLPIIEEQEEPGSSSSSGEDLDDKEYDDEEEDEEVSSQLEETTLIERLHENEDETETTATTPSSTISRDDIKIQMSNTTTDESSYVTAHSHLSPYSGTSGNYQHQNTLTEGDKNKNNKKGRSMKMLNDGNCDGGNDDDDDDDTEEYYSDFATSGSVSSGDTLMNLQLQHADEINFDDNHKNEIFNENQRPQTPTNEIPENKEYDSYENNKENENENDDYNDEDEDIKIIEQGSKYSEKLYTKQSTVQNSMPDLYNQMTHSNHQDHLSYMNRSTDLDELFASVGIETTVSQQQAEEEEPQPQIDHESSLTTCSSDDKSRLSVSMGNLNSIIGQKFYAGAKHQLLLETDIDSGYVSLYQPNYLSSSSTNHTESQDRVQLGGSQVLYRQTEITSPKIDFGGSLANILTNNNAEQNHQHQNGTSLVDRLKNRAGSIPELRIAESLSKLNVPQWMNSSNIMLEDTDGDADELGRENRLINGKLHHSLPLSQTTPPCLKKYRQNTSNNSTSLNRQYQTSRSLNNRSFNRNSSYKSKEPPVISNQVVLPSQLLKQQASHKSRLNPITVCSARNLLPNKMSISTTN